MLPKIQPKPKITSETGLYCLAFVLALFLRLFHLGVAPLTDFEAHWALQAWDISLGNKPLLGPQPAYVILTSALFYLFNGWNALARLFPALAGSLLIFLPLLFKNYTGRSTKLQIAGVILAFFLALDPGFVALSRLAGSPLTAMSFGLLTLGCLAARQSELAGISAALALLSGPALLEGLLGLGLAWLAVRLFHQSGWLNPPEITWTVESPDLHHFSWKKMLAFGAITFLLIGTGLLFVPQGLGAFAATLADYLTSWITPTNLPIPRLLGALVFYQPLAVLFGIFGFFLAWVRLSSRQPADYLGRLLSLWAALALFVAVIYPGHQVASTAWALVPLWGLAALALSSLFPGDEPDFSWSAALGHAGLTILFLVLIGHNLLRLESLSASPVLYVAVVGGILLMSVIVSFLVAAGWSLKTALWGLSWGTAVILLVLMSSFTWKSALLYLHPANELWSIGPAAGQLDELTQTLTDLSWRNRGQPEELDVTIKIESPSLRWALRFFENAQFKPLVAAPDSPSVIITNSNQQTLSLPASYRGQDLILTESPAWTGAFPSNLLRWIAFRQAPTARENLILWVRNDLFPGGSTAQTQTGTP